MENRKSKKILQKKRDENFGYTRTCSVSPSGCAERFSGRNSDYGDYPAHKSISNLRTCNEFTYCGCELSRRVPPPLQGVAPRERGWTALISPGADECCRVRPYRDLPGPAGPRPVLFRRFAIKNG